MRNELQALIQTLASLRDVVADFDAQYRAAQGAFESEYAELIKHRSEARGHLAEVEEEVRQTALAVYEQTQEKDIAPGVKIRIMKRLEYDADQALAWAKQHDMALALDKRVFEQVAKVNPPEFVMVREEPQATIAKDLHAPSKLGGNDG